MPSHQVALPLARPVRARVGHARRPAVLICAWCRRAAAGPGPVRRWEAVSAAFVAALERAEYASHGACPVCLRGLAQECALPDWPPHPLAPAARGSRRSTAHPWFGRVARHGGPPRGDEPPQEYGDLLGLVATLRALRPRCPRQQAIRDDLLGKLAVWVQQPGRVPGGRRPI